MTDIVIIDGEILTYDTQNYRAANILAVQIGSLEYAPDLGIDLRFFLDDALKFQNESFKSYTIQILANYGISVDSIDEEIDPLSVLETFNLSAEETDDSLIAK